MAKIKIELYRFWDVFGTDSRRRTGRHCRRSVRDPTFGCRWWPSQWTGKPRNSCRRAKKWTFCFDCWMICDVFCSAAYLLLYFFSIGCTYVWWGQHTCFMKEKFYPPRCSPDFIGSASLIIFLKIRFHALSGFFSFFLPPLAVRITLVPQFAFLIKTFFGCFFSEVRLKVQSVQTPFFLFSYIRDCCVDADRLLF